MCSNSEMQVKEHRTLKEMREVRVAAAETVKVRERKADLRRSVQSL